MITPIQAARQLRQKARNLPREVERAEDQNAKVVARDADQLSAGTMSYSTMRKLDHPYATRHGVGGGAVFNGDPAFINTHPTGQGKKGLFRSGWRLIKTLFGQTFVNVSPEAKFLEGTTKMIGRPIASRVEERVAPVTRHNIIEAVRRSIR